MAFATSWEDAGNSPYRLPLLLLSLPTLISLRQNTSPSRNYSLKSPLKMFRIGNGYDVHRLVEGRKLILCGVEIPHHLGLLGHSDADVALHALSDALLGAAALRDIGYHFPDTDPRYKGADSRMLLRETARIIREQRNLHPVNIDVTIIAQAPKLLPHIPQMIQNIADDLSLPLDAVSVKATTTEHLGFTGRGEGIAAQASALLS